MALSKEIGLDSTLGARKNALIAPIPNTREQQERTQQVVWEHAVSRPDYVDLMCVLFQPPRPDHRADGHGDGQVQGHGDSGDDPAEHADRQARQRGPTPPPREHRTEHDDHGHVRRAVQRLAGLCLAGDDQSAAHGGEQFRF